MTGLSLEQRLHAVEIQHPRFADILSILQRRIDGAARGDAPMISWIVGPSRVGKTQLIRALKRLYPQITSQGHRRVPVAFADSATSTTIKLLPMVVLKALDAPFRLSNITAGKLTESMYTQLKLAQTSHIVFDEASQMVEPGARLLPFAAGEWFKQTVNIANVSQVLFGVPRLERLFEANVQLRMRAYTRIDWLPYDAMMDADRVAYQTAVNTFLQVFRQAGWDFEPSVDEITGNCYLHAPGLIGRLSDLMRVLARQIESTSPRRLRFADFSQAAASLESCGHPDIPAFKSASCTMADLSRAYRHVLHANGMAK
ncbi:MAG: ATP-binding protein [Burkholderiales bacterium]|nr:ATP-binding protein [Burkholderiales bacterium]